VAGIIDFAIAWREIAKATKEKRRKDALYKVLVGNELNYLILQDLANLARDTEITIQGKDFVVTMKPKEVPGIDRPPKTDMF
jgi:hypothetical protein